jgi:hypothetical protein
MASCNKRELSNGINEFGTYDDDQIVRSNTWTGSVTIVKDCKCWN